MRAHPVTYRRDGSLDVTLNEPDPAEPRPRLMASLRRGSSATTSARSAATSSACCRPTPIPASSCGRRSQLRRTPTADFGWGHSVASDHRLPGDGRSLRRRPARSADRAGASPGIAEAERDRPVNPLPEPLRPSCRPIPGAEFRRLVEAEELEPAQALVRGAIHDGLTADDAAAVVRPPSSVITCCRTGTVRSTCQKAFELLDLHRLGASRHRAAAPRADDRLRQHARTPCRTRGRSSRTHWPASTSTSSSAARKPTRAWHDDGTAASATC